MPLTVALAPPSPLATAWVALAGGRGCRHSGPGHHSYPHCRSPPLVRSPRCLLLLVATGVPSTPFATIGGLSSTLVVALYLSPDAISQCIVGSLDNPAKARASIKLLDFKPFNPVDKRTEITCRDEVSNDALVLSLANVGIGVDGVAIAARGAADIVLAEPNLSMM
ncbi:plasma membrane H+-ATPase [Ceratobasidium sp. 414]|nr:plasma membrane H+-ATPase [Ceratobasidium sp. 414]